MVTAAVTVMLIVTGVDELLALSVTVTLKV